MHLRHTKFNDRFQEEMVARGFDPEIVQRMFDSGFGFRNVMTDFRGGSELQINDGAYGTKQMSALFPFERMKRILSGDSDFRANPPSYQIGSLDELLGILQTERHQRFFKTGRMTFRGQSREYHMQRPFPNPVQADSAGLERLIIPSFWRRFHGDWKGRFGSGQPESIFQTWEGDALVYYGLPPASELSERNMKRYGIHSMSDLEDFDDPESREYGRRWRTYKMMPHPNLFLIEQHYGIDTCGLDVTFDPGTAIYFATNKFRKTPEGKAFYEEIETGEHQGVLYSFVFTNPGVTSTRDLIREVGIFGHIPPTRPIRQQCALLGFDAYSFNAALTDVDAVFYLKPDFDTKGLPRFRELFPGPDEDPFYAALLDIRQKDPSALEGFVEYV